MITCTAMQPTPIATDQSALLSLKAHITSDPFQILSQNWSSTGPSSSICDWIGVQCGSRHHRVTALNISGMALAGTIPPHLGNLSFLVSLDMSINYFHGNLPQELSRLRRVRFIDLGSNNLTGKVPTWLGQFPQLQVLGLKENEFVGLIPSSISNLSKLESVSFDGNSLTGEIPVEIGNFRSLTYLNLQNNYLVGSIPLAIFNITTLEIIAFTYNNLTGSLPVDICHHLPSAKRIFLSKNQLNGQIPSNFSGCPAIQILSLSYNNFSGFIPKQFGNLEMLEILYVGGNNLQGAIPWEIGNLQHLKKFAMERNSISGSIPKEIGNLTMVTALYFGQNFLTGAIPWEIGNLQNLKEFAMERNSISGSIPKEIGNLTMVTGLHFGHNSLTGAIPEEICKLQKLEELIVTSNHLNGLIPRGIFNLSTLRKVSFEFNHFNGSLPSNIGYRMPNLEIFTVDTNEFRGVIPVSIVNCSKLILLSLASNKFSGSIPKSLWNLELLETLYLEDNHLTSDPTSLELDFFTSFTSCKSLKTLQLGDNPLKGILPKSIGNLSTSLQKFDVSNATIRGPIPSGIGNPSGLFFINLGDNQLTGHIPRAIQNLKNLQALYLSGNKLGGTLDKLCNMHRLANLSLSLNEFSGQIPDCLDNMTALRSLYLPDNLLTSSIPRNLWKLTDLILLDLASNSLNGSLPPEIGNLKAAIYIDLSMNQISGAIPITLGDLLNLQNLSLANNKLQGPIPESFGKMISLTTLDLSHNNLSGLIPKSLEKLQSLKLFNVSSNHLKGEIPSGGPFQNFTSESFSSNDGLCGDLKFQVPPCQTNQKHKLRVKRALVLVIPLVVAILVVLAFAFVFLIYGRKRGVPNATNVLAVSTTERISYYELLQATNGYSESNLVGSGSFGSVYKGILNDGKCVAVKVFNLQLEGSLKSFDVESEVLRNLRHRNLVKVISCCSNQDFKALVLEYMSNGSLEKWLHSDHHFLSMSQRLEIMIDVACALQYLHQEYSTPVIHSDLKPSNILIDENMVAHVSDFGISKFLGNDESTALTKTLATIGYIAPEYGREGLVSKACDVYSYGILLMEVFTGRRPNDEFFGETLSLRSWVNDSMPNSIRQVIDANLLKPNEEHSDDIKLECVSLIMELAMNCVRESPKERLTASDVVAALKKIKLRYDVCHGG